MTDDERFMPSRLFVPWRLINSTQATAVNVAQREPMSSVPGADHVDLFVLDQGSWTTPSRSIGSAMTKANM